MTTQQRIIDLVKPEYRGRVPRFVRGHAERATCASIEKNFPEIYEVFNRAEEPGEEARSQMSLIVNEIYRERLAKHRM